MERKGGKQNNHIDSEEKQKLGAHTRPVLERTGRGGLEGGSFPSVISPSSYWFGRGTGAGRKCFGCRCTTLAFSIRDPCERDDTSPGAGGDGRSARGGGTSGASGCDGVNSGRTVGDDSGSRFVSGVSSAASRPCGRSNVGASSSRDDEMRMRGENSLAPPAPSGEPPEPPLAAFSVSPVGLGASLSGAVWTRPRGDGSGAAAADPIATFGTRGGTAGDPTLVNVGSEPSFRPPIEFLGRGGSGGRASPTVGSGAEKHTGALGALVSTPCGAAAAVVVDAEAAAAALR